MSKWTSGGFSSFPSTRDPLSCDDATVLTQCPHQKFSLSCPLARAPDMRRGRDLPTGSKPPTDFRHVPCDAGPSSAHIYCSAATGFGNTRNQEVAIRPSFAACAPGNGPTHSPSGVGKRGSMLVPSSDYHAALEIATTYTRTQLSPRRCLPASGSKGSAIAPRRPERRRTTSFLRSANGLP